MIVLNITFNLPFVIQQNIINNILLFHIFLREIFILHIYIYGYMREKPTYVTEIILLLI